MLQGTRALLRLLSDHNLGEEGLLFFTAEEINLSVTRIMAYMPHIPHCWKYWRQGGEGKNQILTKESAVNLMQVQYFLRQRGFCFNSILSHGNGLLSPPSLYQHKVDLKGWYPFLAKIFLQSLVKLLEQD